jgi:hypothetical protein
MAYPIKALNRVNKFGVFVKLEFNYSCLEKEKKKSFSLILYSILKKISLLL